MATLVGKPAPKFKSAAIVKGAIKPDVSLDDYEGKWVVLFFYPLDFTFVCPTEIRGYDEHAQAFRSANCEVLGASTDSVFSHKAWTAGELGKLTFPLLADTSHEISRKFGVLIENKGI